jgi:hypothetical protein
MADPRSTRLAGAVVRVARTLVIVAFAATPLLVHPAVAAAEEAAAGRSPTVTYPQIVGAGDIASCSGSADSATAAILGRTRGTVFTSGDNVYPDGTLSQFRSCYHPTWGRFKARTRPATGNHDYHTTGAAGFFDYFGSRAGPLRRGYYAYNLGTWRIYVLNSNCDVVSCAAGSAQDRWLRANLAAYPRQCVLAIWHHPLFSSGQHGNDPAVKPLWDALYAARAEIVINGHDHNYERFERQTPTGAYSPVGIREFVVGTGGAGLRPFGTIKPHSLVRNATAHGVLRLTLATRSFGWRFTPVAGHSFTDHGWAPCR